MSIIKNIIGCIFFYVVSVVILWRFGNNSWESIIWLLGFFMMSFIRKPHKNINQNNDINTIYKQTLEKNLLKLVFMGGVLMPISHLFLGIFRFADYVLPDRVSVCGVFILCFGLWLFWRSHRDLGRNWSVTLEIREGHSLVTSGVYNSIRHPMYSGIFLIYMAQPFLIHNWIVGFSALSAFSIMYLIRTPHEEDMMRKQFGEIYDSYCQMTGRLWPKF